MSLADATAEREGSGPGSDARLVSRPPQLADLVGNTPLVQLGRLCGKPGVQLFGKLEGDNPGGSVKDRAALWMIRGAEKRGLLKPGVKLIEPTSGNTGIALAMIATTLGYEIELVMPDNSTAERTDTMRALGAEVVLTPADESMMGSIDLARQKVEEGGYLMLDQFSNPDNPRAHYESTGPEIWRDTEHKITHFVSSMGTTGTIMGTSRYLKEKSPDIQICGVHPAEGAQIPGIRKWEEPYVPKIHQPERVDRMLYVSEDEANAMARRLAREEGVFAGMSSGGAVHAALEVCEELEHGVVVVIICDRGDRYLSSPLFKD
ncbi:MAG TPA: cysteine synthase CysM [Acidobacteriota bacterium]|nr:cysteine synthase CysM [Acidobacteriota bacterium]